VVPGLGRSEATSAGSGGRRSSVAVSGLDVRLDSETVEIKYVLAFAKATLWGYSITG